MKRISSKILIIFMIFVILFEFTCSSNISYAAGNPDIEFVNGITNLIGGIVSIVLWIPRILVVGITWIMNEIMTVNVAESCGISDAAIFAGTEGQSATPFDVFFNKYKLFDVDFFNITDEDTIINNIRTSVAGWFYVMRNISAIILLCILIYVGIRMAISTVADDKAKYKKMLFDWGASLALIFVLQYIAIFTITANNIIVDFLRDIGYNGIDQAIADIMDQASWEMGIGSLVATFVYCMIVFQTISFMIVYIQRMLKVAFLLIIAPLISITYSIDKMGDGKAQALDAWLKEFVYTILIQPFHCIMYLAFVNVAIGLLNTNNNTNSFMAMFDTNFNQLTNGFFAILCLKFINDGEKIVRKIFNFQDDSSLTSMAAGAALGMAAIANAKKIGSTTAKGINKTREGIKKYGGKYAGYAGKIGTKLGLGKSKPGKEGDPSKDGEGSKKPSFGEKLQKLGETKPARAISKAVSLGGEFKKTGFYKAAKKTVKRSMPAAMAMMGAAMSYATGTSGAMEAIGVGSGMNKGTEEFFNSTLDTVAEDGVNVEKANENAAYDDARQASNAAIRQAEGLPNMSTADINKNAKNLKKWEKIVATPLPANASKKQIEARREAEKGIADMKANGTYDAYTKKNELESRDGKKAFLKEFRADSDNSFEGLSTSSGGGKADIEAAKSKIFEMIGAYIATQRRQDGQSDTDQTNILDENDMNTAEGAMNAVTASIDRSVMGAGGTMDMSKILQQTMGLYDDGSSQYQEIMKAAQEYRKASIKSQASKVRGNAGKLGIGDDTLNNAVSRRSTYS